MCDDKGEYEDFENLVQIVARLRDPNGGCPWDIQQTHESLKPFVIEEAYEVISAIDKDPDALPGELGDLLLQVLMHAQLGQEKDRFTIHDVIEHVSNKLVRRHPHVFGDVEANSAAEVLTNWEKIKQKDLKRHESILDGVPDSMPALMRAQRIGDKASRVGFDWIKADDVKAKVLEEAREFIEASNESSNDESHLKEEFGDLLFALTQLARKMHFNSEELLNQATDKFSRRFRQLEKQLGGKFDGLSLEELDKIWEKIKSEE